METDDLIISNRVTIPQREITMTAIRAQGAGGQHVNTSSTAIHLQFDIHASSLPAYYKERLLAVKDKRISSAGIITIKAQEYRSQEQNRQHALNRLADMIRAVTVVQRKRIATRPSKGSKTRRLDSKNKRGQLKARRRERFD